MILLALMTLVMMTGAASALSPLKIDDMRGAIFPEAASRGTAGKIPPRERRIAFAVVARSEATMRFRMRPGEKWIASSLALRAWRPWLSDY
jgi:hypothetical protein